VAPSHPSERQQTRQRGGGDGRQPSGGSSGGSGARAVPRGGSDSSPSSPSGGSTSRGESASSGRDDDAPSRRAVPAYSRPRDGRTQTGTAVDRANAPRVDYGGLYPYYGGFGSSYYRSPYRLYYVPSYGFGLGYFYDPLWYDPFYGGYGYGSGGYGAGGGYGYGGGYAGGSGTSDYGRGATGSLRLKIKPREAQVFVDGYFVGDVDNFDGLFQKLGIDAGGHRVEIRAEGYEPIQFEVLLTPGETVTYKGELKRK
jgi:hypothetical protein